MPHSAKAVANFFLEKARTENKELTQMQLHKLVYFAHGWHLGLTTEPLIDEPVEAWKYGPVVRSIWDEFKLFGSAPITKLATDVKFTNEGGWYSRGFPEFEAPRIPHTDKVVPLLERIWTLYGHLSAARLSALSHEPDGPWDQTVKKYPHVVGKDIDDRLIAESFKRKAEANKNVRPRPSTI